VLDATRPAPLLMPEIAALLTPATALVVVNKIDLPVSTAGPALPHGLPVIRMSALTGDGVDELVAAIVRHAESFRQEQGEDLVAINARHATALRHATEHLRAAIEKISGNGPPELLASDLRAVLDAFGEIAGRIDNERVLDRIFTQFCIGK
jgi:tRNA modification GTPase